MEKKAEFMKRAARRQGVTGAMSVYGWGVTVMVWRNGSSSLTANEYLKAQACSYSFSLLVISRRKFSFSRALQGLVVALVFGLCVLPMSQRRSNSPRSGI